MTKVNPDDLNEARKRWITATSSRLPISRKIKEEMVEAGLDIIKSDHRFGECLGDRVNNFVKQVKESLIYEADFVLDYTTNPSYRHPYPTDFRTGGVRELIEGQMIVFAGRETVKDLQAFQALEHDYHYLRGVASRVIDEMAKIIAKHAPEHGIGFTHPADIAKYQPERVNDTNPFAQRVKRDPTDRTR